MSIASRASFSKAAPLIIMCLFGLLILLTGGGARSDIQSLVLLRPAAVLASSYALWSLTSGEFGSVRVPMLLLFLLAVLMAIQLIPLPPTIWMRLPGRAVLGEIASAARLSQPWYPISFSPIRTWNSLFALTVPIAALLLFARLSQQQRYALLPGLLFAGAVSALLGLAQVVGPPRSQLYFYEITNQGSAVGLFSNRNHQAAFLACMLPMLAVLAGKMLPASRWQGKMALGAGAAALFFLLMIIVSGSRGGVVLAIVALLACWGLKLVTNVDRELQDKRRLRIPGWLLGSGVLLLVIIVAVVFSRAESLTRLLHSNESEEARLVLIRPLLDMIATYFPVGAGFGAFENLYRMFEPLELSGTAYVNHAHNDLFEFVIEGGLPGVGILFAFLIWWGRTGAELWLERDKTSQSHVFARLGFAITAMLLLGSLFDYPVRTPIGMALFAIGTGWMGMRRNEIDAPRVPHPEEVNSNKRAERRPLPSSREGLSHLSVALQRAARIDQWDIK